MWKFVVVRFFRMMERISASKDKRDDMFDMDEGVPVHAEISHDPDPDWW